MRCGELTYGKEFDRDLTPSQADFDTTTSSIHLPWAEALKNAGIDIPLPVEVPRDVCALQAIKSFISNDPSQDDPVRCPLLSFVDGSYPSSQVGRKLLDRAVALAGLACEGRGRGRKRYTGHSFRRGAATWAKSTGASEEQMQKAGRWSGSSWRAYVDTPVDQQRQFTGQLYTAKSTLPASGLVDDA
jgi:hypothetical protein